MTVSAEAEDSSPEEETLETTGPEAEPARARSRVMAWFDRRRLSAEERRECLEALAIRSERPWWVRFFIVMVVSVVIATVGQLLDSAAVVIGAMLIAPLMTPVLALSAALAMGWPFQVLRQFVGLLAASLGAVGIAWLIGNLAPSDQLTDEVLSRTSPDLRDLIVALAAGFGGAYVTVRRNMVGSLPGVAVAVALVPPLGAVGLSLSTGQSELAEGAGLLYGANLAAIVLAGLAVFLFTGFVPVRRLSLSWVRVAVGSAITTAAVVLIAIPLARQSADAVADAQQVEQVNRRVAAWLSESPDRLADLDLDGSAVTVAVVGPAEPPAVADLRPALEEVVGSDLSLQVRWIQESNPLEDSESDGEEPSEQAPREEPPIPDVDQLEPLVAEWLAGSDAPATAFEVTELEIAEDGSALIALRSAVAPPPGEALTSLVEEELGAALRVTVEWTDTSNESQPEDLEARVRSLVRDWVSTQPDGLSLDGVEVADGVASVDIVGPSPPSDAAALAEAIDREIDERLDLEVRFTQRQTIPTSTTTTPPPATTPSTSTPSTSTTSPTESDTTDGSS